MLLVPAGTCFLQHSWYTEEMLALPLGFVLFSDEVFFALHTWVLTAGQSGYSLVVVWKTCSKSPSPASPVRGVSEIGAQARDVPGSLRESLREAMLQSFSLPVLKS